MWCGMICSQPATQPPWSSFGRTFWTLMGPSLENRWKLRRSLQTRCGLEELLLSS